MSPPAFRRPLARLHPFLLAFAAGLAVLALSRVALSWWTMDRIDLVDGMREVFLGGLRVDIATLCGLLGVPAAAWMLLPARWARHRVASGVAALYATAVLAALVFLEASTPAFMGEYGLRPNRIFVEYLIYPQEVAATVAKGHAGSALATMLATALAGVFAWRWLRPRFMESTRHSPALLVRSALAIAIVLASALGVRSSCGHRPMNPAMLAFSEDPTVNVLPLNSTYSVFFAVRALLQDEPGAEIYGSMPVADIVREVRAESALPADAYVDPALPTLARRTPSWRGTPRNLVIVLEESLGAGAIGHLGGLPLSPEIDALSREAWTFERLYATGTRSVRGIEAVLTGFTPTPAQAVVKQPGSQHGFFTLADLLRRHGYDTTFYYGGESHFDNMRGFFLGNGFTRMIEQNDYRNPSFTGSWGVSDEDLFARADEEFDRLHAEGKPFFGLVFSSSNHDPFEFPDGRITLYEEPKQTRNNAAKYADHAVGTFFRRARASGYWHDTVFLVVADHAARVLGQELVPIGNFHVPGLILGPGIAPRRDGRIVSQIDLPPTLLSLVGVGDATPMTGQDLTDPTRLQPGRAMMQYDANFAWMEGDRVVVLQPGQAARQFAYRREAEALLPTPLDPALSRRALAQALWATHAYGKGLYRLPGAAPGCTRAQATKPCDP